MATTADLRNGLTIRLDGKLHTIVEFQHVKPGKGGAFVRTKLKKLDTGQVIDKTLRAGEWVDIVRVERRPAEYLYADNSLYYFMERETYEQFCLPQDLLGDCLKYLKENTTLALLFADGKPVGVELPTYCELKVVATDPGLKGDTATGGTKPATLETGLVLSVPLFIQIGDLIRIDTRSGEYLARVIAD